MKKMTNYLVNLLLIVGLTGFVLWFTLKDNFNEVMGILSQVQFSWLAVIVFVVLFYQLVIGWILTQLTKMSNPHYKLRHGFLNALVASFFHGITPSASGGQFAQVYVFKKQGVAVSDSASVLWMDFVVYQSTMILSVLLLILCRFHYFYTNYSQFFILVLFGFFINGLVIVGLWALAKFPVVYTWLSTKGIVIAHKLHIVKDEQKALTSLQSQLERFASETKRLKNHRILIVKIVIANLFRLALYYSIPFFCAKALGIKIGPELLISVMALSSFVSMINAFIPIPGASGGTEATYVLMFSTILGKLGATTTMILWRVTTYYFIMIIGAIAFIIVKQSAGISVSAYEVKEKVEETK